MPQADNKTTVNMVLIVVMLKMQATKIIPAILLLAAGTIRMGMSGSQGPKTNTVKSIHGVMSC